MSDRPDEYTGKKGLVKQQIITVMDLSDTGERLAQPIEYALSDEEKQRLAAEGDRLTRSFQRKQQELQDDGNEDQREIVDRIGRKMLDIIDKYSKEAGYTVVFDISAQNTPVVYAANQIDITQEIVRRFDQAYPVKSATATPKPAAPRAATPQAQPKQPQ